MKLVAEQTKAMSNTLELDPGDSRSVFTFFAPRAPFSQWPTSSVATAGWRVLGKVAPLCRVKLMTTP